MWVHAISQGGGSRGSGRLLGGGQINRTYRVVKSCQSMFVEVLLRFCFNFKVFLK